MENERLSNLTPEGVKAIIDYSYERLEEIDDESNIDYHESDYYTKEKEYYQEVVKATREELEKRIKQIFP